MRETLQKCLTKFYKDLSYLPPKKQINQEVSVCCPQHLWRQFGCLYEVTFYLSIVFLKKMIVITHTRTQALLSGIGS